MKAPYDSLEKEEYSEWMQNYGKQYSGAMRTTVLISKQSSHGSLISCPENSFVKNKNVASLALKHCRLYTPAWDRGVRVMSNFLQHIEI